MQKESDAYVDDVLFPLVELSRKERLFDIPRKLGEMFMDTVQPKQLISHFPFSVLYLFL